MHEQQVKAPFDDGAYFVFTITEDNASTSYTVRDSDVERQYEGSADLFLKTSNIRDESGMVIPELVAGKFNMFEVKAKNTAPTAKKMTGILAVYDVKDTLVKVVTFKHDIGANTNEQFGTGTVVPDVEGAYLKLFMWEGFSALNPIFQALEF